MSENKKPRLAEVLGVEVGEKFDMYNDECNPYFVDEDGYLHDCDNDKLYLVPCEIINNLDLIKRRPRWTEQEVEDAKALKRLLSKDDIVCVSRSTDGAAVYVIRLELYCDEELDKDTFPSLRSGETVALSDIIGGNE